MSLRMGIGVLLSIRGGLPLCGLFLSIRLVPVGDLLPLRCGWSDVVLCASSLCDSSTSDPVLVFVVARGLALSAYGESAGFGSSRVFCSAFDWGMPRLILGALRASYHSGVFALVRRARRASASFNRVLRSWSALIGSLFPSSELRSVNNLLVINDLQTKVQTWAWNRRICAKKDPIERVPDGVESHTMPSVW